MTNLVILNEDALRATHPVMTEAGPDAHCVFIWDTAYFAANRCGLKRQVFLYETLCELRAEIYVGLFDELFPVLLEHYSPETVWVPFSVNPQLKQRHDKMVELCDVQVIHDETFVNVEDISDLRRFFRYWNKAKKAAFSYNGIRS